MRNYATNETSNDQYSQSSINSNSDLIISKPQARVGRPIHSSFLLLSQRFFGTREVGIQTDLTRRDIDEIIDLKKSYIEQLENGLHQEEQSALSLAEAGTKEASFLSKKRNPSCEVTTPDRETYQTAEKSTMDVCSKEGKPQLENNCNIKKESSVPQCSLKNFKKQLDPYQLFKNEYHQMNRELTEEELEKNCKEAWISLPKDLKKFYNLNAENEKKKIKRMIKEQKMMISNGSSKSQIASTAISPS